MKRNYKIYMHKNKINGKVYIGQTYTSLRARFGKNGIGYKGCPIFYNAIQKYGWDNFEHEILEENIPNAEIANEREKFYIALYNSTNGDFGYNIQIGGNEQTKLAIKVYQYSLTGDFIKEYDSMADAMRELNISNGKISDCCKGNRKSAGGFMWSYEKVDKLETYKKKSRSKPVYQYSLDGKFIRKFDTVTEASKFIGCNSSKINSCCNLKIKTSGGYQWRYEYHDYIDAIKSITRAQMNDNEIVQIDKLGNIVREFSSTKEASLLYEDSNKAYNTIKACLSNNIKSAYGYIWIYKIDLDGFNINNYIQYSPHMKEIKQYDLDMNYLRTFKSISDASKEVNGATGNISKCCLGKYKTAYGYIWKYAS